MRVHKIVTTGCIAELLWKLENWFISFCTQIRIGGHTKPDSTTVKTGHIRKICGFLKPRLASICSL